MNQWDEILQHFREQQHVINQGGGAKAIARQHDKSRLIARERIERLIDVDTSFFELGQWAAWNMYEEWGGAPAASVVCGIGTISGREVMVIANDATVKAGAFFPMTAKKVLRAQKIALTNRLPICYLVDSSGVFLPLQDEIFPDEDDFGRIFRNNAVISAAGVPQIAAIMGNCVAGGGYLPVLCDKLVMTSGSGLYLAGPALVKSSIGQEISHEELGGAQMHAEISGTIDFLEPDDESCLKRVRSLIETFPVNRTSPLFRREMAKSPARDINAIYQTVTSDPQAAYDVRDVLECLIDQDSFQEYKAQYGKTLVCGYARWSGFPVGIVGNQHQQEKSPQAGIQFGGVIYPESADKAARFILDCNQTWTPIVFLQDVYGFMVGKQAEQGGIIRAGAKLVNAIANSRVPKITVITGGSFGAGNYALCGKAFDPRFLFAWPTAKYAVMGARQAAATLLDINIAALKRTGRVVDADEMEVLRRKTIGDYEEQMDIRYAAARGWVDAVIEPAQTRELVTRALEWSTRFAEDVPLQSGVWQV
ncbi:MAG: acyl-CoA carboxylase subunit beta [Planctomycetota bacterium]|nr:acyl-CoA carboxylase subunit beta [Planctomycetota bacterium]MDA1211030.1 acyl-CoA carboxylase subunit beta [Planctomycetota bacterium]